MGRPDIKHWWFYGTFRRCLFPALAEETMSLYMHSKLYLFSQTHIYIYTCTYFRRELLKFTSAVVYFSCKTLTGILEWQRWHSKFAAKYHLLLVTANCGKASSNASRMGKYCPRLQIWIPRFPAKPALQDLSFPRNPSVLFALGTVLYHKFGFQNIEMGGFGMIYCLNLHSISI